jgi:hypothetical protein
MLTSGDSSILGVEFAYSRREGTWITGVMDKRIRHIPIANVPSTESESSEPSGRSRCREKAMKFCSSGWAAKRLNNKLRPAEEDVLLIVRSIEERRVNPSPAIP